MAQKLISELINISKDKKKHLINILKLTKKQSEAIQNDKIEDVQNYIVDKQKEIDIIDKSDNDFVNNYNKLKNVLNITKLQEIDKELHPEIKLLKSEIQEINELLNKIFSIEFNNNENMKKSFNEVKTKLKQIRKGKKATLGYTNNYNNINNSIFINKKK